MQVVGLPNLPWRFDLSISGQSSLPWDSQDQSSRANIGIVPFFARNFRRWEESNARDILLMKELTRISRTAGDSLTTFSFLLHYILFGSRFEEEQTEDEM